MYSTVWAKEEQLIDLTKEGMIILNKSCSDVFNCMGKSRATYRPNQRRHDNIKLVVQKLFYTANKTELNKLKVKGKPLRTTGPTRCTVCCQSITINSLYLFQSTYLLIIRRYCVYSNWCILCVLCRLAASNVGVELSAPSPHNTHKIYQLLYIQCLLIISK
jgi:hypothetical protein